MYGRWQCSLWNFQDEVDKKTSSSKLTRQNLVSRIMSTLWSFSWYISRITYSWIMQIVFVVVFFHFACRQKDLRETLNETTVFWKLQAIHIALSAHIFQTFLKNPICFCQSSYHRAINVTKNCDCLWKKESIPFDGRKNSYFLAQKFPITDLFEMLRRKLISFVFDPDQTPVDRQCNTLT